MFVHDSLWLVRTRMHLGMSALAFVTAMTNKFLWVAMVANGFMEKYFNELSLASKYTSECNQKALLSVFSSACSSSRLLSAVMVSPRSAIFLSEFNAFQYRS